ncbi:hypothetical protein [Bradyrhizobium sp. CCGUVB14]|nr:hypothetical protein [Bradyrhizobium sp. CCGUVB14]MCP3440880.1 hypothetical protein [Bradyrhizobium sp. CCGUVB14]
MNSKQVICKAAKLRDNANLREDASRPDGSLIDNGADAKESGKPIASKRS